MIAFVPLSGKKFQLIGLGPWTNRKEIIHGISTSKLGLYAFIESKYGFEQYFDDVSDFKKRKNITQLSISAHKFPIESGRYKKIPRSSIETKMCDRDEMGDEFHYLFRSGHGNLTQTRVEFIRRLLKVNSNFSLFDHSSIFHYIISMKDKTIQI